MVAIITRDHTNIYVKILFVTIEENIRFVWVLFTMVPRHRWDACVVKDCKQLLGGKNSTKETNYCHTESGERK